MMHFKLVQYLADRGYIVSGSRIMDVGTQNMLYAEEAPAIELIRRLRAAPLSEEDIEGIRRICHFSTPRAGERTTFLHELLAYTDVAYESIDIVDGLKTTIFDLNFDEAPAEWLTSFDLIVNCGTLEHVINQYKALTFIHSILKVGGVWFDQPPSVGFLNHGYYNYNPLFYLDIAAANNYELVEAWYSHAGGYPLTDLRFPIIDVARLDQPDERRKAAKAPFSEPVSDGSGLPNSNAGISFNFNVAMRKNVDIPLRLPLEVRTTHGPVGEGVQTNYGTSVFDSTARK